jgi:DNA polymerase-3 subunit epsilon
MREIVFDTETTGLDPFSGDRIVEIGCIEVINSMPTGETYWTYVNPERDMPKEAERIHGITEDFLRDKPTFGLIFEEFLDFIGDDILVAHNADFDMKFINWELENIGRPPLPMSRVVDTLQIARAKFPGQANSLDALCRRFKIENGHRTLHGALLDSEILADVYLELKGGRQGGLELISEKKALRATKPKKERLHRSFPAKPQELENHDAFMKTVKDPLWHK